MNKLTVLLAEDNRGDILMVREALAKHEVPHELFIVRDGGEALAFVARMGTSEETPCPDLVLLDLNMPKADGPAVLTEFRKHPRCARTPVIAISSSDSPKDRDQLAKLGVSRYFRKPLDYDEFLELGMIVLQVMRDAAAEPGSQ